MLSNKVKLSIFLCLSTCIGVGIFRFSYTALLPSTREAFAWSANFASILGSANLLGYLIGAIWSMKIPQHRNMSIYVQIAAFAGSLSLFSCAFSIFSEYWYIFWRVISGVSGGLIMILSPSIVAQYCKLEDRFTINVIGFSGIGIGVLLATLFLPYIDQISTTNAWLILFIFSLIISAIISLILRSFRQNDSHSSNNQYSASPVTGLYISLLSVYACSAFAYIPHSLFWIDYLSHTLHFNLFWINSNWILYGLGSSLGAVTAFILAQKLGNINALKVLYSIYVIAILIAMIPSVSILTFASSFLTGMLNPAVVFLTSYTILQLYGAAYKKLWSLATICFASTQLIGGLSFSALQHFGFNYHQQFMIATCVLFLGTLQLFYYTQNQK